LAKRVKETKDKKLERRRTSSMQKSVSSWILSFAPFHIVNSNHSS
jgi:hypothetical protein